MKKYLYLFYFGLFISISAQNFIINVKHTKSFEENFGSTNIIEVLFAPTPEVFNIGVFAGFVTLSFNFDGYKWVASYEDTNTRIISGLIAYIYPLKLIDYEPIQPIYLSLAMANVSKHGILPGGGYMYNPPGYVYPGSKNEKSWIISSGYKIPYKKVNFLLGFGYQFREYDLTFTYIENDGSKRYSIHQKEKFFLINIGLQIIL
ncbi:MAG: hypothetical protein KKF62_04295 [Bacteroidetes bacterium]|nr:hypothetical protein [Bacteroidota bacterium]MBU1115667.1 hypothetical protein [Bacteroidota bacterium]MBU1799020.1 hypothetical protein [Bacteroidota bacterium]